MSSKFAIAALGAIILVASTQSASAGWVVMSDKWCLHNNFKRGCQVYNGSGMAIPLSATGLQVRNPDTAPPNAVSNTTNRSDIFDRWGNLQPKAPSNPASSKHPQHTNTLPGTPK